jgi:predicted phage replisome organizer
VGNDKNHKAPRYFWLKLKDDFFNSDDIKVVMSQTNGAEYVIFWQKLLLKAITRQEIGLLRYRENIPYTPELLSTITDTNIDVVKGALTLFQKLGMIELLDNGDIWIEAANYLVGSESQAASRMRKMRERNKGVIETNANTQTPDNRNIVTACYEEIE